MESELARSGNEKTDDESGRAVTGKKHVGTEMPGPSERTEGMIKTRLRNKRRLDTYTL